MDETGLRGRQRKDWSRSYSQEEAVAGSELRATGAQSHAPPTALHWMGQEPIKNSGVRGPQWRWCHCLSDNLQMHSCTPPTAQVPTVGHGRCEGVHSPCAPQASLCCSTCRSPLECLAPPAGLGVPGLAAQNVCSQPLRNEQGRYPCVLVEEWGCIPGGGMSEVRDLGLDCVGVGKWWPCREGE